MVVNKRLLAKSGGINLGAVEQKTSAALHGGRDPRTTPGKMIDLQDRVLVAEEKARKAEEALANQSRFEVEISHLVEVEGRRRHLTKEQYEELKSNLQQNPLAYPIVIRAIGDGRYELVAGHNRVDVYKELGRTSIPAILEALDDDAADRVAFYSNLLSPSLTDFEKFNGLKARMDKTGLSQLAIAGESGLSKSHLSRILSFDRLPQAALDDIRKNPSSIGATTVSELAKLCSAGYETQVTEVVKKIVAGEIDQAQGVLLVKGATRQPQEKPSASSFEIKNGRATYCKAVCLKNSVRFNFQNNDEAARFLEEAKGLLAKKVSV